MCHEIQIKTAVGFKLQNCIKEKAFGVSRGTYLRFDLLQLTFVDVTALHGAKGVHLAAVPVAGCSALEHFGRDLRLCCLKKSGNLGPDRTRGMGDYGSFGSGQCTRHLNCIEIQIRMCCNAYGALFVPCSASAFFDSYLFLCQVLCCLAIY